MAPSARHRAASPRSAMDDSSTVLDDDLRPIAPGSGVDRQARAARAPPARLLQGPREDGGDLRHDRRRALGHPRRPRDGRGGRAHHRLRPRRRLHQQRRREDLPRGGRGGAQGAPRRRRRGRRRRARRALGRARRRRRPAARRRATSRSPSSTRTAARTSPATRCRAQLALVAEHRRATRAASPTTAGPPRPRAPGRPEETETAMYIDYTPEEQAPRARAARRTSPSS